MTEEQAGPWGPQSLRMLLTAYGLGVALMAVGWFRVSGSDTAGAQIGWLNLSVFGVLLTGTVNAAWLLRGRQGVTRLRVDLLPPSSFRAERDGEAALAGRREANAADGALVAAAHMTRYHRADCQLAAGKEVSRSPRQAHESSGRRPCEVCRP